MRSPRNPVFPRKDCPLCGIDVAISRSGRLRRHVKTRIPDMARFWCPGGGKLLTAVQATAREHGVRL